MSDRYFVDAEIESDRATLRGSEAHHLKHVMRAPVGTPVTLFDGSGQEFSASVDRISRTEIELSVLSRRVVDRELPDELVLAVALPKSDRGRWLVEKITEVGVTRLVPLLTRRGVARPNDTSLKRLRRTVVEASKQCGRNRLMQIDEPVAWPDFAATSHPTALRLIAHPGHTKSAMTLGEVTWDSGPTLVAIGPEGGFADDEIELALQHDWRAVDLGPRILRVETAAIVATSYLALNRAKGPDRQV